MAARVAVRHWARAPVCAGLVLVLIILVCATPAFSNGLTLSDIRIVPRDHRSVYISLNIEWENSWRYTNVNHDAVWLFFKYQREGEEVWRHAKMDGTGLNPTGYTVQAGTALDAIVPADHTGLFLRRAAEGLGSVTSTNVGVVWNIAADGLTRNAKVRVQALGVEMVYVPEGPFSIGSGGMEGGRLYQYTDGTQSNLPFVVTSATDIATGTSSGRLWGVSCQPEDGGSIPSSFPNGYSAFYCMKYEVSQGQYRDFLNTLSRAQQGQRTASQVPDSFSLSGAAAVVARNGIRCPACALDDRLVFGCDLNDNGVRDELSDGEDLACNFLSWADGCAFADWAGLRPFTELEYEKMARGPLAPFPYEFAWGNDIAQPGYGMLDGGTPHESYEYGNLVCSTAGMQGPARVGLFSTQASSRQSAGASYWGIMELSGNVWERPVTVGHPVGRDFSAIHGDGLLSPAGEANTLGWPASDAQGAGFRGGNWLYSQEYARVSNRDLACHVYGDRFDTSGARCVRTAPAGVEP